MRKRIGIAGSWPGGKTHLMPLLERDEALAALAEYYLEAGSAQGRLVLIAGEAGIGKSALVEQFQRDNPHARWAGGSCDGLFTPRPLGPLFDIAEQLGGDLLEACRRGATRDELFAITLREIDQPRFLTCLLIEDVHWADESTLDLLLFLGRRVRAARTMLIVTYRDDALASDNALRIVLGGLAAERGTRRIRVQPLSPVAVALLAAGCSVPSADLHRLTGGNPFFVTEVIRADSVGVPPSARDAVLSRVATLSLQARAAAEVAALVGARVDPALLAAAGQVSAEQLDELVESGLLVSDAPNLAFRHEIIRLAIQGEIPAHRGRVIHARLLGALRTADSDDLARLAFHSMGAGDRAAVMKFAPRAGRRASSLGAHREAAAHFADALRFADPLNLDDIARLNDELCREASFVDDWPLAARAAENALQRWRTVGNARREGDTLRTLSVTRWRLCQGDEAVEQARAAVEVLEPLGSTPELARAYVNLAAMVVDRGDLLSTEQLIGRARALADELQLPDVHNNASIEDATIACMTGHAWLPILRRALESALKSGDYQQAARAYANLVWPLYDNKQFADAQRYLADGMTLCDEHDIATYGICLRGTYSHVLLELGRWEEALTLALDALTEGASPFNRIALATVAGQVLARRGDAAAARPHLDEAMASAVGMNHPVMISRIRLVLVEAHWLANRNGQALAEIDRVGTSNTDPWTRGTVAAWQRRLGLDVTVHIDSLPEPYRQLLAGNFAAAAGLWDELNCPYEAALAMFDVTTEEGLREALRRFDILGAHAAAQITRRAMRQQGIRAVPVGTRPATRSNPAGLTRREQEVLALICADKSNSEISQHLVISMRTVDHHVSAVLGKLRVPSRRAAAAHARRNSLV